MDNIVYDKNIFAANLQRLMKRDREKQIDVARLLDVSKSTVSAYCSGAQMPRMDKLELLARHYGVTIAALVESGEPAPAAQGAVVQFPPCPASEIYYGLNRRGQAEYIRYGEYLSGQPEFRAERPVRFIKRYIVPAAAGYASPIEGEDYGSTLQSWAGGQNVIYYAIFGLAGINFVVELLVNLVLSSGITTVIKYAASRR